MIARRPSTTPSATLPACTHHPSLSPVDDRGIASGEQNMVEKSEPVTIKEEKKSKLWKIPPFPGHHPNTHCEQRQQPVSGESGFGDSKLKNPGFSDPQEPSILATTPKTPVAAHQSSSAMPSHRYQKPKPAAAAAAKAQSPITPGHEKKTHTYGVMTTTDGGRFLHPSQEAVETRMNCMYPCFRLLLKTAATTSQTGNTAEQQRATHIKKIWSLVVSVMDEFSAKKLGNPEHNLSVHTDSALGLRVNYLMKLQEATKELAATGTATGGAVTLGDNNGNDQLAFPSHEEMLAYRILSKYYGFPPWMTRILSGTEHEYLMYPLPPATSNTEDTKAATEKVEAKKKLAKLKAKIKQAEIDLQKKQKELEALTEQKMNEAEQQRAAIDRDAQKRLEKIKAKDAHVKKMLSLINTSAEKLDKLDRERILCSHRLSDQIKTWQKEGKRLDEADTEGDESASSRSDEEEEEEEKPPAKKRRYDERSDA